MLSRVLDMDTATKTKTTCTKCGGTGQYNAPTCYSGGCFSCKGSGYFLVDPRTVARREARDRTAEAKAAQVRAASGKVTEILLNAWADEFDHIAAEYRHMHCTEKARRILRQEHRITVRCTADLAEHLPLLGIAA